jgi:hypothetical protein
MKEAMMRDAIRWLGYGLAGVGAVLILLGVLDSRPQSFGSHMSAAAQVAAQNWDSARAGQRFLLGMLALFGGAVLVALTLKREE